MKWLRRYKVVNGIILLIFLYSCGDKSYNLTLVSENTYGLLTGAEINTNGMKIGYVKDIQLSSEAKIEILCAFNANTQIPNDSRFIIDAVDLLGTKALRVDYGTSKTYFKNNDRAEATYMEADPFPDLITDKVNDFFESLTSTSKQDSILIELRRLNENLEKIAH